MKCVYLFYISIDRYVGTAIGIFLPKDCYTLLVHNLKVILDSNFVDIADRYNQLGDIGSFIAI